MTERRKYSRIDSYLQASYQTINKSGGDRQFNTTIRNISGGGVCLLAQHRLKISDYIHLFITIPCQQGALEAIGEVAWTQEAKRPGADFGEAGIVFRDIGCQNLHHIFEYVHSVGIG